MNKLVIVLFAALLCVGCFGTKAGSRITFSSNDQEVVGTLLVPEGEPAPVVLLLHGFTGRRDELKSAYVKQGVFVRTAVQLAEAGFASLRIDFRGSGESQANLTFADTTFESQVTDGLAAIDYLKSLDSVDSSKIRIIGWSQGGLVATAVAGRSGMDDPIALWNAVTNTKSTYSILFGEDVVKKGIAAARDEPIAVKLPWGSDITLNGAFFHGIETFDPINEVRSFPGPLLVVQGKNDTVVDPAGVTALLEAHDGAEALLLEDMDHGFNLSSTRVMFDLVIAETIAFFKEHQLQ